jgi:hypothetical protein
LPFSTIGFPRNIVVTGNRRESAGPASDASRAGPDLTGPHLLSGLTARKPVAIDPG